MYRLDRNQSIGIEFALKDKWNTKIIGALKFVIDICNQNKLCYFLCAGSVLGAVRHHGIIPWDDDIDIMMPRKDYEKLKCIFSEIKNPDFSIIYPEVNSTYYLMYVKVFDSHCTILERTDLSCLIGPFIDIFPIDGCPDDNEEAAYLFNKYQKYQNYWSETHHNWNCQLYLKQFLRIKWKHLLKHTLCHLFRNIIRRYTMQKMHAIESMYNYENCDRVISWCGQKSCEEEIHKRSWMGNGVKMQFEGMNANIPSNYDAYLKCMYGDYLQLPPEEERVSHHYVAYLNLEKRETIEEVLAKLKHKK